MASNVFLKTNKTDTDIIVVSAFRTDNRKVYFLLHRIKNQYAKSPLFLVELSNDIIRRNSEDLEAVDYRKLYVVQSVSDTALDYLKQLQNKKHSIGLFGNKEIKNIFGSGFEKIMPQTFYDILGSQKFILVSHKI